MVTCAKCGLVLVNPASVPSGLCYPCRSHAAPEDQTAPVVAGVGKDAPVVVNSTGGKQSHSPYRADLLPPHALLAVAAVLKHGADKYGANNWYRIPVAEHLNHALVHLYALAAGDGSDDHIEHAACRILMALDQQRSGRAAALVAEGGAA